MAYLAQKDGETGYTLYNIDYTSLSAVDEQYVFTGPAWTRTYDGVNVTSTKVLEDGQTGTGNTISSGD